MSSTILAGSPDTLAPHILGSGQSWTTDISLEYDVWLDIDDPQSVVTVVLVFGHLDNLIASVNMLTVQGLKQNFAQAVKRGRKKMK
ncbi:hypothetical protein ElyMa_005712900 [Elysia marginata]|uniref:Uncharacterized protein n=1 Tax=Elysia marginata TaxID=1093978 RepID=A0AAV4FH61_9GAST|nr:hypothetical protein ElyMa_005712900 [Elysia marginata]